jgi:hypothetical protein
MVKKARGRTGGARRGEFEADTPAPKELASLGFSLQDDIPQKP